MSTNKEIGQKGEDIACNYLISKDFIILERNWRNRKSEIDIICKSNDLLVFVEVKTRSYAYFGQPEDAITEYKERLISAGASAYMELHQYEWAVRFDVISIILLQNGEIKLQHYEDVWF